MALTRSKKQELLGSYEDGLADAQHAFVLGFKGMSVPEVTELRDRIRETGGQYQVVKNTLALRAVDGKALAALAEQFKGPTAVAFTGGDVVGLAKALSEFRKVVPAIEFKGGLVEGVAIDAEQVEDIAKMASRDELLAKLLYLLQSPITRLARGLAAIPRQFVVVLDQVAKKREETA
jgi:large subunit ribosomal protein L10